MLLDEIHQCLEQRPHLGAIDIPELPCLFCLQDFEVREECFSLKSFFHFNQDNSYFSKELMATYHIMLHSDEETCNIILFYKDIKVSLDYTL